MPSELRAQSEAAGRELQEERRLRRKAEEKLHKKVEVLADKADSAKAAWSEVKAAKRVAAAAQQEAESARSEAASAHLTVEAAQREVKVAI